MTNKKQHNDAIDALTSALETAGLLPINERRKSMGLEPLTDIEITALEEKDKGEYIEFEEIKEDDRD